MFTFRDDGSIDVQPDFKFSEHFSERWYQDPEDAKHFIPKFDPCKYRLHTLRRKSCGRMISLWMCNLLNEGCSVDVCKECTKRVEG